MKWHQSSSVFSLGPGSLPGYARRRLGQGGEYDDGASDISSTSGFSAYGYRSGNFHLFKRKRSYLKRFQIKWIFRYPPVPRTSFQIKPEYYTQCNWVCGISWCGQCWDPQSRLRCDRSLRLSTLSTSVPGCQVSVQRSLCILSGHRRSLQDIWRWSEASRWQHVWNFFQVRPIHPESVSK